MVTFSELSAVSQLIEVGKLRALGITTAERSPAAPIIPPLVQVGLPGFNAAAWQMLTAPAGADSQILSKLNAEVSGLVSVPEVKKAI